ncbi:MAG: DNA topoisomerase I, partial [Ruminococcaceae bacterium]|nr:DNA topoisomerase I [Oscillospiraceae bacterium]
LVVKSGRFGRFLACPGWPECDFTMPLVVEMPGKCPACGGRLFKRTGKSKTSGKQYTYYACEKRMECPWRGVGTDGRELIGFMTFDVPVKDNCPACGHTMFKRAGRGARKPFCINEACTNFTPEEKRGGWQKKSADESGESEGAVKKAAAKKTAAKKETAKKTAAKKPAAKKTAAKKTTAKKTAKKSEE